MAFAGILGSLMGNVGLIEKGANLLGIDVAPWAKAGMGIAAETFGGRGEGPAGMTRSERLREAKSYGGDISMGQQQMVGVGEQKASAAVEYEDELARINNIIRLYAKADV
jgi:hypothetical protein